ncbi:hypothetical protein Catovirus_1_413 [Catovirus CTV1]|uniref:NUDIX hydrolase n=1 Tax=Catovirus CTV1 TaxID=1977631 RepID=A0A1V0S9I7_9VIRU|nr:hypothetical protein Catovirus_1_413 [Catovirus CTV1]
MQHTPQHTFCKHNTCHQIRVARGNFSRPGGIGIAFVNNYYNKDYVVLLGKERGGNYAGQYNICSGKVESQDNGCYIKTVIREALEEFKIDVSNYKYFDQCFKAKNGKIRFFMFNGTPIFVGIIQGVSRATVNNIIANHNQNPNMPHAFKEIECVDYFKIDDMKQVEKRPRILSSFAMGVMGNIKSSKIYLT